MYYQAAEYEHEMEEEWREDDNVTWEWYEDDEEEEGVKEEDDQEEHTYEPDLERRQCFKCSQYGHLSAACVTIMGACATTVAEATDAVTQFSMRNTDLMNQPNKSNNFIQYVLFIFAMGVCVGCWMTVKCMKLVKPRKGATVDKGVQSQVTYKWRLANPRFVPLGDAVTSVWTE